MNEKALENEVEKYNIFADLKELQDNYSDDIPSEIIHDGPFKVRKFWWLGVIFTLHYLAEDKKIPEELIEEVKNFKEKFSGMNSDFPKRPTTAEDIAEANSLINKILESQK